MIDWPNVEDAKRRINMLIEGQVEGPTADMAARDLVVVMRELDRVREALEEIAKLSPSARARRTAERALAEPASGAVLDALYKFNVATHPLEDENRRLREALNKVANCETWKGRKNYGHTDADLGEYWSDLAKEFQETARTALAAEPASGEAERIAPNFIRGPNGNPLYVGRRENAPPPTQSEEETALKIVHELGGAFGHSDVLMIAAALRQRATLNEKQHRDLLNFQNALFEAANPPADLLPEQVTPWFVARLKGVTPRPPTQDGERARNIAEQQNWG